MVIAPVVSLIVKPVCDGEIVKVLVPVPPVTVSAPEVYTRPWVVVKEVKPVTVIVSFTVRTTLITEVAPRVSVTVMDSL